MTELERWEKANKEGSSNFIPRKELRTGTFIVVRHGHHTYKKGTLLTLIKDDRSAFPLFTDSKGLNSYTHWSNLLPYITDDTTTISIKPITEHEGFKVGEQVVRTGKSIPHMPNGMETLLVSITKDGRGHIHLGVLDQKGDLRPMCGTSAWKTLPTECSTNFQKQRMHSTRQNTKSIRFNNMAVDSTSIKEQQEWKHITVSDAITALTSLYDIPITQKETTMPQSTAIQITVNGETIDLCKHESTACLKPKTDLESKKDYTMVMYNPNGSYRATAYKGSMKAIKRLKDTFFQSPGNLGCTVTIHKVISEFTTNIPVVQVK